MKLRATTLLALCAIAAAQAALGAEGGLDEMIRRASRRKTNAWPQARLEADSPDHAWQSETLCFRDTQTGAEVWRMTDTPNLRNYYHNDIAMSPWSADGKRLGLQSWRMNKVIPGVDKELRNLWMVVDAGGGRFRPTVNSDAYCHWSPLLSDVYYTFGGTRLRGVATQGNVLYKVTVSDDGPATAMKPLVTYPTPPAGGAMGKFISADGRMIVAKRSVTPGSAGQEYEIFLTPTRIYPDEEAKALLEKGYTTDRDFGDYTPRPWKKGRYHDSYLLGDGSWYFAIDRDLGYWRIKTLGSAPDGGAQGVGKELLPADARIQGAKLQGGWPALQEHEKATREKFFLGHPGFDRWGEMVNYADYDTQNEKGAWCTGACVYDFTNNRPAAGKWMAQTNSCTHCDWEAFSDWCITSVEASKDGPGRIECFPYDQIGRSFVVCYTGNFAHGAPGGGTVARDYYNYIRPAQSPDGTKVAFHSDFLNGAAVPDCYWAVACRPKPPTEVRAETKGGSVLLTWKMPEYTKRGWPTKADPPPPAREIRRFRVWRAKGPSGPWEEIGSFEPKYKVDDKRSCAVPEKLEFADARPAAGGCYAVTSEEWSGLESDVLSEVVDSGGRKLGEAGTKDYWKAAPPAPEKLSVTKGASPGHHELSWSEPGSDKVRYYNVYYSTEGPPAAEQKNRIASLPAGTTKYLDWLADPAAAQAHYAVTSVDRQGNESAPAAASAK